MNEDKFICDVQQTYGKKSRIIITFNGKRIGTLYLDDLKTSELMKSKLEFGNEPENVDIPKVDKKKIDNKDKKKVGKKHEKG